MGIYGFALAMTIGLHVPSAIPRSDKTICPGDGGITKNFGVINRINSVQAAWYHKPAALARVIAAGRPSSGRDAENSRGGDDSKRDESVLSPHWSLHCIADRKMTYAKRNKVANRSLHLSAAFRQGLAATGYFEGRNLAIEYRYRNGADAARPAARRHLLSLAHIAKVPHCTMHQDRPSAGV
jgi:hypothetical protein